MAFAKDNERSEEWEPRGRGECPEKRLGCEQAWVGGESAGLKSSTFLELERGRTWADLYFGNFCLGL